MSLTRNAADGFVGLFKVPAAGVATPYVVVSDDTKNMMNISEVVTKQGIFKQVGVNVNISNLVIETGSSLSGAKLEMMTVDSPAYINLVLPMKAGNLLYDKDGDGSKVPQEIRITKPGSPAFSETYTFTTDALDTKTPNQNQKYIFVPSQSIGTGNAELIAMQNLVSQINFGKQNVNSTMTSHGTSSLICYAMFGDENTIVIYTSDQLRSKIGYTLGTTANDYQLHIRYAGETMECSQFGSIITGDLGDRSIGYTFAHAVNGTGIWHELQNYSLSDSGGPWINTKSSYDFQCYSKLIQSTPGFGILHDFRLSFTNADGNQALWKGTQTKTMNNTTQWPLKWPLVNPTVDRTRGDGNTAYLFDYDGPLTFNGIDDMSEFAEVTKLQCTNGLGTPPTSLEGSDGQTIIQLNGNSALLSWSNMLTETKKDLEYWPLGRDITALDKTYNQTASDDDKIFALVSTFNSSNPPLDTDFVEVNSTERVNLYTGTQAYVRRISLIKLLSLGKYAVFKYNTTNTTYPDKDWPSRTTNLGTWTYVGPAGTSQTSMTIPLGSNETVAFWVGFGMNSTGGYTQTPIKG